MTHRYTGAASERILTLPNIWMKLAFIVLTFIVRGIKGYPLFREKKKHNQKMKCHS